VTRKELATRTALPTPRADLRADAQQRRAADKAGVTVDRIVAELAKIAFSDIRKASTGA